VSLSGPNGNIPGVQTHDELKTIFFSFAPLALDDTAKGDYQITVILQDRVGNQGEALTFSFTYQPTAPILAETQPEDGEKAECTAEVYSRKFDRPEWNWRQFR